MRSTRKWYLESRLLRHTCGGEIGVGFGVALCFSLDPVKGLFRANQEGTRHFVLLGVPDGGGLAKHSVLESTFGANSRILNNSTTGSSLLEFYKGTALDDVILRRNLGERLLLLLLERGLALLYASLTILCIQSGYRRNLA